MWQIPQQFNPVYLYLYVISPSKELFVILYFGLSLYRFHGNQMENES
jgi:hypothetical protein